MAQWIDILTAGQWLDGSTARQWFNGSTMAQRAQQSIKLDGSRPLSLNGLMA
jgi:hypothetical protein